MTEGKNPTETWFREQIVSVLYANIKGAIMGSTLNIALVSFVLWTAFPGYGLLFWFLSGQILNLLRLLIFIRYEEDPSSHSPIFWLNTHRVLTIVSGLLYGILAFFFFSSNHPLHQNLVILLCGGMGAAAVGTHSVDKITYQGFLFASVIPLVIRTYMEGTEVHFVLSAMLCLLMLIMIRASNQSRKVMIDNIIMSQSLRYRATHDSLVNLLNRDEFQREFERLKKKPENLKNLTCLIFIDLDNFKVLNDTLGHQAGDKALIQISEIIRHCIRQTDIAARFGGDEFMILLSTDDLEQAEVIAQKICMRITHFQENFEDNTIGFGASVGIGYSQNKDCNFDSLLKAADKACYEAKNAGKGQIYSQQAIQRVPSTNLNQS